MPELTVPELQAMATSIATSVGISVAIFLRQIKQESGWDPSIVNPDSGCAGLGQLHPRYFKGDLLDPHHNLTLAAREMQRLLSSYNGSYFDALVRYNYGAGNVNKLKAEYGADWAAWLPAETKAYIDIVLFGDDARKVLAMRSGR